MSRRIARHAIYTIHRPSTDDRLVLSDESDRSSSRKIWARRGRSVRASRRCYVSGHHAPAWYQWLADLADMEILAQRCWWSVCHHGGGRTEFGDTAEFRDCRSPKHFLMLPNLHFASVAAGNPGNIGVITAVPWGDGVGVSGPRRVRFDRRM